MNASPIVFDELLAPELRRLPLLEEAATATARLVPLVVFDALGFDPRLLDALVFALFPVAFLAILWSPVFTFRALNSPRVQPYPRTAQRPYPLKL